ncbi:MAG: type II secretion system minor pseudopilin GspH [Gammaproteobacteria bacterium]|nr:type II secretion system minor pseudopilin GspH [Gammaproteobacteria bacterium]
MIRCLSALDWTRRAPGRAAGFTLLEILVVVLIIGIVLTFATLTIRDDIHDRLKTEARRLAALLTLASQETVLQGAEMAVAFSPQGYRFQVLDEEKWVDAEDPVLRKRELPGDLSLFLEIEGVTLAGDGEDKTNTDAEEARIYLFSSGEMTPFTLTLKDRNSTATYQMSADFGGEYTFEQ